MDTVDKVALFNIPLQALWTIKVTPGLQLGHAEALKVSPALYPYEKSSIKTFSFPKGYLDIGVDNIYQGDVPSSLIIGLLNSDDIMVVIVRIPSILHISTCPI